MDKEVFEFIGVITVPDSDSPQLCPLCSLPGSPHANGMMAHYCRVAHKAIAWAIRR